LLGPVVAHGSYGRTSGGPRSTLGWRMQWTVKTWQELARDELYAIVRAREAVFVVEQACPYQDADGEDPAAVHLWAAAEGAVIAYARLFAPGVGGVQEARIGRVITTAAGRGHGLGRELMQRAINEVADRFGAP